MRSDGEILFSRNRIIMILASLVAFLLLGTVGFWLLEEWSFVDSLYMSVITVTTVGFGEVRPLSTGGRMFTMFYVLAGVGFVGLLISRITAALTSGVLQDFIKGRKMLKEIARLENHYVLCGFGNIGHEVAMAFAEQKIQLVIIERNPEEMESDTLDMHLVVKGDATHEDVLINAGIERAAGLITALETDANNLFVVLTARGLNPDLFIISRAVEHNSQKKLLRAGADKVVAPTIIGGQRMATMMLQPAVTDFLDTFMGSGENELRVVQLALPEVSPLAGQTIRDTNLRKQSDGALIMNIYKAGRLTVSVPTGDTTLEGGDVLVVLGTEEQISNLEKLIAGKAVD